LVSHPLPERGLSDLLPVRSLRRGEAVDELERFGDLVVGHAGLEERLEAVGRGLVAIGLDGNDERDRHLAVAGMGRADDLAGANVGVVLDGGSDLAGCDEEAANSQGVVEPRPIVDVPVSVRLGEITGIEPSLFIEGRGRRRRLAEVAVGQ